MSRLQQMIDWVTQNLGVAIDPGDLDFDISEEELMADLTYGRDDEPASTPPTPPSGGPPPPPSGGPPPPPSGGPPPPRSGGPPPMPVSVVNTASAVGDSVAEEGPTVEPRDPDEVRDEFDKLDDPIGTGLSKIVSTKSYAPSGPIEIPGTSFNDVCPGQPHVNRKIVEDKISKGLPPRPLIPVVVSQSGQITLYDSHHTFVACMAVGKPVRLALTGVPIATRDKNRTSWKECTWKGFEKPQMAVKGFRLTSEDSAKHEGKPEPIEDWKSIVPWRKDTPPTDEGKVDFLKDKITTIKLGDELQRSCEADPELATQLFELVQIGLVNIQCREPHEGSTGGDWDADSNTIFVDKGKPPLDTVDMLIFEAGNARHASDYSQLQHEAYDSKMDVADFGDAKAKIEANVTIEYVEHLLSRKAKGMEIAENGKKTLAAIEKHLPGYSEMKPTERGSKETNAKLVELIVNSPHGGADVRLPDRNALSTKELYSYEQATYTQGVKGIKSALTNKIPKNAAKRSEFFKALNKVPDGPAEPYSWAGKFYAICSKSANSLYDLGLKEFSAQQLEVAEFEYGKAGGTWADQLTSDLKALA